MLKTILSMYITALPVILAGILNMLCVKQKWFKRYAKPLDRGTLLRDKKRIFGDNKTDLGIFTMIVCSIITHIIWGEICKNTVWGIELNKLYVNYENVITYNIIVGVLMGIAYMLFELPNSFIKRRINIPDGKTLTGIKGKTFMIIDQIDSMFGIALILVITSSISILEYLNYVILGGMTHITVNWILHKLKIRKNL